MKTNKRYKLTVILVVVLLLIIGGSIRTQQLQSDNAQASVAVTPTPPPSVPQTTLELRPTVAEMDSDGKIPVYVSMETNNNRVTSIHFSLSFDPKALQATELEADDAFYGAQELVHTIDNTNGKLELTLQLTKERMETPVEGGDHVAEVTFVPKVHSGTTQVSFVEATVTSPDTQKSVLTKTENNTVKLGQ